jgi:hypothetical protein
VTIGANCHCVTTADQPNGPSMPPPSRGEPTHRLALLAAEAGDAAIVIGGGFA